METARRRDARAAPPTPSSLAFAILVIFVSSSEASERPAPGPAGASHMFSYTDGGSTGPDKWGTLGKDWVTCGDGTKQSPIDITKVEAEKDMGPLKHTYKAATGVMHNRGHDFMLKWNDGNGKLTVEGKDYTLQQVHWHVPSEHTLNGTRYEMEMHMVHQDSSKGRAVVSVLFSTKESGQPSTTLSHLGPYFKRLGGKENAEEEVKEPVDPSAWIDDSSSYYRYQGSLTTPPCTEGVLWTILTKVKPVSKEQIEVLESVTKDKEQNDRPAQKINGRVVRYYEAGTKV